MSVGKIVKGSGHSVGMAATLALLIALASSASPAKAGSFRVNPVQINLPADRQITSLTITNSDTNPVSVRVVTYAWTQRDGEDVRTPTANVITSPPIFTIPAGKTQLVRIGLKNRVAAGAYRVIFEEIPGQKQVEGQIQVNLRLDLPLYVLPKSGGKPVLDWSAWRDRDGQVVVEGRNSGNLHGQVLEIAAADGSGRGTLTKQMGVVLAGSAKRWKIGKRADLKTGMPLTLAIRSPTGETQTRIVMEQR